MHVTWGGGKPQAWEGSLELSAGRISSLQRLGLHADEAAAIFPTDGNPRGITILHRTPRTYDGMEFTVQLPPAESDSIRLQIELRAQGEVALTKTLDIDLSQVRLGHHTEQLDDTGNRLLIRRAPGDSLRLQLDRDVLIFEPGETWKLPVLVDPFMSNGDFRRQLEVTLNTARSTDELWSDTKDVPFHGEGNAQPIGPFEIPIPAEEGVYQLELRLKNGRFRDTIVGSKPVLMRRVQFVVLSRESQVAGNEPASDTAEFDAIWQPIETWHPTETGWSDWLARLPAVPWLSASFSRRPLGNDKAVVRDSSGTSWTELAPGGWQAFPLPVADVARPHILEIEFPQDVPQSLGVRIVEPDASGRVVHMGLDSGLQVPWAATLNGSSRTVHRLLFWPKSRTPLVILVNHDPKRPARFGRIRVLAGPTKLPPAQTARPIENGRLATVYFHKPFWPATFSATQGLDPNTGRSLDDWQTFYEAGTRLVEYLKHVGYNGAVVCVASEGSAVFPSQHLAPNPKFDTGTYFTDGRDPVKKDVVELLMRLFERESLTLIPAVELSGALPEIEALRRSDEGTGLVLHDGKQAWSGFNGDWKSMMPPYNPLDPRVQASVEQVFSELAGRYGKHASFGGVAWLVGGQGIGLFPGPAWGRDRTTWKRFETAFAEEQQGRREQTSPTESDWLQWRSRELLAFQRKLQRAIAKHDREARLLILTPDLFAENDVKQSLRPDLLRPTDFRAKLLRWGLEPERYRNEDRIILVQPKRLAPPFSPAQFSISYQQQTQKWQSLFRGYKSPGVLFFHEPIWRALPGFDRQSPFGSEKTQLTVFSHLAPPPQLARARFVRAIAEQDPHLLLDGGWELALGSEEALRPLMLAWTSLPAEPFQSVPSGESGADDSATTVRLLRRRDDSYLYLTNAAPWPTTVTVRLHYDMAADVEPLGEYQVPAATPTGGNSTWTVQLKPFDLVAFRFETGAVRVLSWQSRGDEAWGSRITEAVRTLRAQANRLRLPPPLETLNNAGFEQEGIGIPGWIAARTPGITIRSDDTISFDGRRSLYIRSDQGIAWVRSTPLPAPRTGRIFVLARLRTSDPKQQPPLRIAIDGRNNGRPYYRSARVGAGTGQTPRISADWGSQPFLLPITDLPTSGWQDFRIGFDLMGKGEVWIDDIKVYDMYFLIKERQELMLRIAVHESLATQGRWMNCYQFLESYWPQLLFSRLDPPPARVARALDHPLPSMPPPKPPADNDETQPPEPSLLERLRPKWPKKWYPF